MPGKTSTKNIFFGEMENTTTFLVLSTSLVKVTTS